MLSKPKQDGCSQPKRKRESSLRVFDALQRQVSFKSMWVCARARPRGPPKGGGDKSELCTYWGKGGKDGA